MLLQSLDCLCPQDFCSVASFWRGTAAMLQMYLLTSADVSFFCRSLNLTSCLMTWREKSNCQTQALEAWPAMLQGMRESNVSPASSLGTFTPWMLIVQAEAHGSRECGADLRGVWLPCMGGELPLSSEVSCLCIWWVSQTTWRKVFQKDSDKFLCLPHSGGKYWWIYCVCSSVLQLGIQW